MDGIEEGLGNVSLRRRPSVELRLHFLFYPNGCNHFAEKN